MWEVLGAYPVCVMDGREVNGTHLDRQGARCTTPLVSNGSVADTSTIILSESRDGLAFYDDCPLPSGSKFGATVKCGFLNPSKALNPVCRVRLRDNRSYFISEGDGKGACELTINATVRLVFAKGTPRRPPNECAGDVYTYSFPTLLNTSSLPIPGKVPPDYTQLITGIVIIAATIITIVFIVRTYTIQRRKAIERGQDVQVQRMYDYFNSKDLHPKVLSTSPLPNASPCLRRLAPLLCVHAIRNARH